MGGCSAPTDALSRTGTLFRPHTKLGAGRAGGGTLIGPGDALHSATRICDSDLRLGFATRICDSDLAGVPTPLPS